MGRKNKKARLKRAVNPTTSYHIPHERAMRRRAWPRRWAPIHMRIPSPCHGWTPIGADMHRETAVKKGGKEVVQATPELHSECKRCGRPLKAPESRKVGFGTVCLRKVRSEQAGEQTGQAPLNPNIVIQTSIRNGYAGARGPDGTVKVVAIRNGQQYPLQHLVHHSPDGFNWGYGGSGPAELARCIVADATGISNPHPAVCHKFKEEFVSGWGDQWEISLDEVRSWLTTKK